jgi:hypothetical protein
LYLCAEIIAIHLPVFRNVIQRLQTVLLFLAFILDGGVFFNALYHHAVQDPKAWIGITFAILLTIVTLASLGTVFLYKNRKNQLTWVNRLLIPQVLVFGFGIGIYVSLGGFGAFLWDETIGLALLFLALVSQIYARKKIKDDIELVKSMDRIR